MENNINLLEEKEIVEVKENLGESLDDFMNSLENEIDKATDEIKVINLGNQLARVTRGNHYVDFRIILSYGDKQQIKALNKAESLLYDESGDSKIEMKLRDNDIDLFILEKQIAGSDLGKLTRISISENVTHLDLFESAVEIIKLKNGLVMTKKQLEKKKNKKA